MDITVQHAHFTLVSQQPLGQGGAAHVDRLAPRLPVRCAFAEKIPEPVFQHEQTIRRLILGNAVKFPDHLRDDARGVLILPAVHQRDEFVTSGVFQQVRTFIVPQ